MENEARSPGEPNRNFIATLVLVGSTSIIVIMATSVIIIAERNTTPEEPATLLVKDIFNAVLPVLATWVGTVIAFYFGRENYETANKQLTAIVSKITPELYNEVPVKQVMIDLNTMFKYCTGSTTTTLNDLAHDFQNNTDKSRLPILDSSNKPLYIIHKSEYTRLMTISTNGILTIDSFKQYGLNEPKGFVVISENASLKDAQLACAKIKTCKDVFITKGGTSSEGLLGWLTDDRILNFLQ